jgi:hypothetical protein
MMNAWAGNIYYYASPFGDEFKMRADSQFYSNIWDNLYLGIANYQAIIDSPLAKNYPHHVAVAKIMKAYYMQMIVDLYNDAPYSEAFKGQAGKHPKYDKGQDIYKALLAELDDAKVLLQGTPSNSSLNLTSTEDAIFGGDTAKWTKMANTVKLKLVVRLSKSTDPAVIAFRDAALQQLAPLTSDLNNFITEDVRINPGYTTSASDTRNPYYQNYGRINLDTSDINDNFRLIFASDHIIKTLRGQIPLTQGVTDSRLGRLFIANGLEAPNLSAGNYVGQPQGGTKIDGETEGDFATLGLFQSFPNGASTSSVLATQGGYLLTLAEVRFLQAEAAVSYPATMAFNGQTAFNAGITESFVTFGSTAAAASTYIGAINSKPGVGWNGTTDKIQAIQYQKWIALTNINPTETFISYNKTGYPQLPMPQGSYYNNRPNRLMYPQSEYISNTANVPNPSIDDMYSVNSYTPFWKK